MGSDVVYTEPNRALAAAKVKPAAIALMIIGIIGVLWQLVYLLLQVLGVAITLPMAADQDAAARAIQAVSGGVGIVISVMGLVASAFIIFAALRMQALTGWGLALTASILAMIPGLTCYCCCLGMPGLPIGIWALIVLLDSNVKNAFV